MTILLTSTPLWNIKIIHLFFKGGRTKVLTIDVNRKILFLKDETNFKKSKCQIPIQLFNLQLTFLKKKSLNS